MFCLCLLLITQQFYIDYVLSIQHLEGLKYYAHRVRTFTFYIEAWYQSPFWDFEPSFLSSLSSLLGQTGQFLFPHLRAVSIIPKTPTRFRFPPYMSLLLSPTLRTVSFPFISPGSKDQLYPNAFWTFMHDLAVYCPQVLRELNASLTLPASVVAAISNFTGLESLVVYSGARSCDLELLHTFSKLPRLQFLSLDPVAFKAPRPPSHVQHPRFFTLTTLQLHADLESSSDFISLVDLPVLKMLALKMGLSAFLFSRTLSPSTIDHWEHLFVQVAARLPHLRTFILQGDYPIPALPWRCFAPLLGLQHLLDVRICMPKVECLSKADFTQIVEAWPLLEHLDIETEKVQPDYVDCDYALTMVASNLPHLRVLNVDLNLNGLGASPHGTSGRPIPHPSLRYLLGISGDATAADTALRPRKSVTRSQQNNSPLDLPQTLSMVSCVACFLDSLFPNIQVVPSKHNGSDDVLACVKSYLITLQQARQRESLNASRLGPGFYKA